MKKSVPCKTAVVRNHDLVHDSDIHKAWAMNLILAASVDRSFLGSTGNRPRLSNDDITTLVADGVAEATIVRIIETYECEFEVSEPSLSELCRRGVGDKVIEAMLSKELPWISSRSRSALGSFCCELIDYL